MGVLVGYGGLWGKPMRTRGQGSLQPLLLALKMIGYELHALISRGGKVLEPGEEGFASALISLRVLIRNPDDPPPADPVLADLDAEIARCDDTDDPKE